MSDKQPLDLKTTSLRLRSDASIEPLTMDSTFWPRLMAGQLGDFHHEYLVSLYDFSEDWPSSEVHPKGDEVVILLAGAATFLLEYPDGVQEVALHEPGSFVFVPQGTWHTAKIKLWARMLFITAGEDTQHRPHKGAS